MHISKKRIMNVVCIQWQAMKSRGYWDSGNYQYFHAISMLLIGVDEELSEDLGFLATLAIHQSDVLWKGGRS